MNQNLKITLKELCAFLILWITQSFSALGSSMTNFALVIWSYEQRGSALTTSLLAVCSYAPYVIFSIFAGALSDRFPKKKVLLISDSFAALCTLTVLLLLTDKLQIWHLYVLNALNGLMNTVQQPASDVTITLLCPRKYYQKVSGMRSFSNSMVTLLTPIFAAALLSFTNLKVVILFDLFTFLAAFVSLALFIKIPAAVKSCNGAAESLILSARSGLHYLKTNQGILVLVLFLAVINFTASIYNASLPAMILSREGGSEQTFFLLSAKVHYFGA